MIKVLIWNLKQLKLYRFISKFFIFSYDFLWSSFVSPSFIISGVPHGNTLWPLLYIIYTSNITKCFHHSDYHLYMNNTQLIYNSNLENTLTLLRMTASIVTSTKLCKLQFYFHIGYKNKILLIWYYNFPSIKPHIPVQIQELILPLL